MGEVYRAEDLTLDHPVALKFLPGIVAAGDSRLAQFHNELKTARQVSHKNVCRLYDLGEAEGRRFLTMEYVDGEDLSSLLRRIGRIPHDKAVDIARQLCAGVAAAHERGVVHRDLKPSNVMIDADGNVRITDFGIATVTGAADEHSGGTPHYMAPEQFTGKPASVRSDVYALGLILFEVFTGRRAVDVRTLAELQNFHEHGAVTTPSSIVRDVDPAVERLILRCLDRDPERRPVSALVVAAALPGGDPLAAALAAGETPSPELLVAAAETSAIGVGRGIALVAVILAGLAAFVLISARVSFAGRTPLPRSPEVLVDRAQQIAQSLGYRDPAGDDAYGFALNGPVISWVRNRKSTSDRWDAFNAGSLPGILFWYRTSPRAMRPLVGMTVQMDDPPARVSNMRLLVLDTEGRLLQFRAVPPQRDTGTGAEPDWDPLFAAAGLNRAAFTAGSTQWVPRDYGDTRAAWDGPLGDQAHTQVHVEAAAYHGRPTSFAVYGPWNQPAGETGGTRSLFSALDRAAVFMLIGLLLSILSAGILLARHNLRQNRADRRGALRVAGTVAVLSAAGWVLGAHHVTSIPDEFQSATGMAEQITLVALVMWVLYVGLEPYVRRFWPDSLLGWSRLASGYVRDPRCGHDVLIGLAGGVVIVLAELAKVTVPSMLGGVAPYPTMGDRPELLAQPSGIPATWLTSATSAIEFALLTAMVVVVLRLFVRWTWVRAAVVALLLTLICMDNLGSNATLLIAPAVAGVVFSWLLLRHGLLSFAAAWFVRLVLMTVPFVSSGSWAATPGNWTLIALVGLTVFAFYSARAGQPLFAILDS
jgi:serine/threonine-protein kinase